MSNPSFLQSSIPCAPRHHTLIDALENAAATSEARLFYHTGAEPFAVTFGDILRESRRWERVLRRRGIARQECVPVLVPTSPAFIQSFMGVLLAGGIPVPLPFPLSMAGLQKFMGNFAPIIADCGATRLITTAAIRSAITDNDQLRHALSEVLVEDDILSTDAQTAFSDRSVSASDTAFLQYTSGTSGKPKGVVISHRAVVANTFAIADGMGIGPADVGVHWLPMFHDMGLIGCLLTALCLPHDTHFLTPAAFVMRPHRWLQLITRYRGTITAAPNFGYELCASKHIPNFETLDLSSWKAALNGSEQVLPATLERFSARFGTVGFRASAMTPVYGMAESTLASTFSDRNECPRTSLPTSSNGLGESPAVKAPIVSVGVPVAGMSVRIVGDDGRVIDAAGIGHVQITGPSLMDGYYRNEQATSKALDGKWLRTGDLGFVQQGSLHIVGRSSDVIIKAGRNIYPADVERVASETLGTRARAIAAFACAAQGGGTEGLAVAIESSETDPTMRDELSSSVAVSVLATLGVGVDDVHICPVGMLPRTTSGKIKRRACLETIGRSTAPPFEEGRI